MCEMQMQILENTCMYYKFWFYIYAKKLLPYEMLTIVLGNGKFDPVLN
jgi:hypothetical protein